MGATAEGAVVGADSGVGAGGGGKGASLRRRRTERALVGVVFDAFAGLSLEGGQVNTKGTTTVNRMEFSVGTREWLFGRL